jgi:hypothetical protein
MDALETHKIRVMGPFLLAVAIGVVSLLGLGFWKYRQAKECRRQVVQLEDAALNYEYENGKAVQNLGDLVPKYIAAIPKCPSNNEPTYQIAPSYNGLIRCKHQDKHDFWLFKGVPDAVNAKIRWLWP